MLHFAQRVQSLTSPMAHARRSQLLDGWLMERSEGANLIGHVHLSVEQGAVL